MFSDFEVQTKRMKKVSDRTRGPFLFIRVELKSICFHGITSLKMNIDLFIGDGRVDVFGFIFV